ncbi:hypothetical protein AGR8A_Cc60401 [Agrobacterium fabrum str. J-07]|nr:hypothetical protein AGR8A_Cc60401 [Agrobacterium fabrum str. J-07]
MPAYGEQVRNTGKGYGHGMEVYANYVFRYTV